MSSSAVGKSHFTKTDRKFAKEETNCYIYRVSDHLRNRKPRAYEPHIVAIGPYHHGTPNTKLMETHKRIYRNSLLQRKNPSINPYVLTTSEIQKARTCYADHHVLTTEEIEKAPTYYNDQTVMKLWTIEDIQKASTSDHHFTEMLLTDGCFIIELLLRNYDGGNLIQGDPIFQTAWMLSSMQRDLMLFENQIPFFVLCKLFNLVEGSNYLRLLKLIHQFFINSIPGAGYNNARISNTDHDIKHLLHLIHIFWSPDSLDTSRQITVDAKPQRFVSSVTKLMDANVKFEKNDQGASLFNITFENGTLKLSHLQIEDGTEALFRNLIAYEQYFPNREQHNFATDYVAFLDSLIDSPGDVEILRKHGIVDNWLGSDEVVSNIFNKLTDSVSIMDNFSYARVCDDMKKHCQKRRNNWMAMLRRNHLGSPWAILSLIAAVVLLLFTAVQTVCSILQL